jgi:hypothetical protein
MMLFKNTVMIMIAAALLLSCAARKQILPTRETLEKRVEEYFSAKINGDLGRMYEFINPSSREKISERSFAIQQKRYAGFVLKDFAIKDIIFTDSTHATVEVIFVMEAGQAGTQFPFVFEDNNWYRHYPTYETDIK